MTDLINIALPFLSTPTNYREMLSKLAGFAMYETWILSVILRINSQHIDDFFKKIEFHSSISELLKAIPHYDVINVPGIVIAILVAILTSAFQFHNRISDVVGIRRYFDVKYILLPLSELVGSTVTDEKAKRIAAQRDQLMHNVFYKYASSRDDKPLVDKHDIEQALGAWYWFWLFLEAIFYVGFSAIIAWSANSHNLAIVFAAVVVLLVVLAYVQWLRLPRYAKIEIETIARDPTALYAVKQRFDAL